MTSEKTIWKDFVTIAKFVASGFAIVASGCAFGYNLGLRNGFFGKHADDKKYLGKEKLD